MIADPSERLLLDVLGNGRLYERISEALRDCGRDFPSGDVQLNVTIETASPDSSNYGFRSPLDGMYWCPYGMALVPFRLKTHFLVFDGGGNAAFAKRLGELLTQDLDRQFLLLKSKADTRTTLPLGSVIVLHDSRAYGEVDRLSNYFRRSGVRSDFALDVVKCDGVEWVGLKSLLESRLRSIFLVERSLVTETRSPIGFPEYNPGRLVRYFNASHTYRRAVLLSRINRALVWWFFTVLIASGVYNFVLRDGSGCEGR